MHSGLQENMHLIIGLCDITITSFVKIFPLLSRYDVFLFVITITATDIAKGIQ